MRRGRGGRIGWGRGIGGWWSEFVVVRGWGGEAVEVGAGDGGEEEGRGWEAIRPSSSSIGSNITRVYGDR